MKYTMKVGQLEEVYEGTPNEILDLVKMLDREKNYRSDSGNVENRSADVENPCWIAHSGEECPVHYMDIVEVWFPDGSGNVSVAKEYDWTYCKPDQYRIVKDEDGVPHCSNEKVPKGTEYVATDGDGEVTFFDDSPEIVDDEWLADLAESILETSHESVYQNDYWKNSLRRVHPSI